MNPGSADPSDERIHPHPFPEGGAKGSSLTGHRFRGTSRFPSLFMAVSGDPRRTAPVEITANSQRSVVE